MIAKIIIITLMYSLVSQVLSYNWYKVCKRKEKGCRNIACKKADYCPYNTLFMDNK